MRPDLRRRFATAAALVVLLAACAARAQVADGGALAGDAGVAPAASVDAAVPEAPPATTKAPETQAITASRVATMMLATPAPVDVEPPRPITRRLWFWMAVTGVIVGGVLIGIAVHNPNHTRPGCPPDYVCPL